MKFKPGKSTLTHLTDVHPVLVTGFLLAMGAKSEIDFGATQGLRTISQQRKMVERGASRTMHSKHLRQPSGYGHAIDFRPLGGYAWANVYAVVRALHAAYTEMGVAVRWGGVWDRSLNSLDPSHLEEEVASYHRRFEEAHNGRKPLVDGVHIELLKI